MWAYLGRHGRGPTVEPHVVGVTQRHRARPGRAGGNGAFECLIWTVSWAAGAALLTTLTHEFDHNGRAVIMSMT